MLIQLSILSVLREVCWYRDDTPCFIWLSGCCLFLYDGTTSDAMLSRWLPPVLQHRGAGAGAVQRLRPVRGMHDAGLLGQGECVCYLSTLPIAMFSLPAVG